tara:strand:+ start:3501 stop:4178 length:678 start_codon:yes stop_codon:yes gene_type:complete
MKTLVVIPARSGSKGLPDKNIKLLNGKPLIHYSIEVAQKVFSNQDICVSTDSQKYISVAEMTGIQVPFLRPEELANDTATTQEVLLHCIKFYESRDMFYDYVLLLQPTSPFRNKIHIEEILKVADNSFDMVVSVKKTKSNPFFNLFYENNEGYLQKINNFKSTRRQDCPSVYEYNGSMYLIKVSSLKNELISSFIKIRKYVMSDKYSIDIDNNMDFEFAEYIIRK